MNLEIKDENYVCTVVKIKEIFPIDGADRIVRVNLFGEDIITSVNTKVGDLCLLFTSGTQLNEEYAKYNSLTTDETINRNKSAKGYISSKQFRIKAVKMKGIISTGILIPLDSLDFHENIDWENLKEGQVFNNINGVEICKKYLIPVKNNGTNPQKSNKPNKFNRVLEDQFYFHNPTENLRKNIHKININDIIGVHYKKHGCVSEDTIIDTLEYGKKSIKEIVENEIVCKIKSYDTLEKEIVYVPIDQYYLKKNEGEWYEIELEDGSILKITSNNPVWLPDLNCYREVKDLVIGDVLLKD